LLADVDRAAVRLGGQTTAVVVAVSASGIDGASVGDSGAWRIDGEQIDELTERQRRKPLVGAGGEPVGFRAGPLRGTTLLVASDGLLRYAAPRDIARIATGPDLAAAARALVELVRLPSGGLQDDVAIVLCRDARDA